MRDGQQASKDLLASRLSLVKSVGSRLTYATRSLRRAPLLQQGTINLIKSNRRDGMSFYGDLVELSLRNAQSAVQVLGFDEQSAPKEPIGSLGAATVVSVTPGHIPMSQIQYWRAFSRHIRSAAVFMWDVDVIPARFSFGLKFTDEAWTASSMGAEYLSAAISQPVAYFPAPILAPEPRTRGIFRERLGLGDKFVVAYQFDIGSSARRKNPAAAIAIYRAAFPKDTGDTHLLLKCARADESSDEWKSLIDAKSSRTDITLVNEFWERELVKDMFVDIDCYLSPHRSEGYGLTVAEAVANGVYVIATAHGGPVDFMAADSCGLIPCRLVQVGPDPIYPTKAKWANPDIDSAADLLRDAFTNRERTRSMGLKAKDHALETFTVARASEWIMSRLR